MDRLLLSIYLWPGMGQLGVSAVFARDYPVLMGTLFFSSVLIIVGNLLADLAYAWVDPRIGSRSDKFLHTIYALVTFDRCISSLFIHIECFSPRYSFFSTI